MGFKNENKCLMCGRSLSWKHKINVASNQTYCKNCSVFVKSLRSRNGGSLR